MRLCREILGGRRILFFYRASAESQLKFRLFADPTLFLRLSFSLTPLPSANYPPPRPSSAPSPPSQSAPFPPRISPSPPILSPEIFFLKRHQSTSSINNLSGAMYCHHNCELQQLPKQLPKVPSKTHDATKAKATPTDHHKISIHFRHT